MDDRCRIRSATLADVPRIAALEVECFSDPWSGEAVREVLEAFGGVHLVAERAGTVVGYALTRVVLDTAEVLTIAVAPSARRAGIAAALIGETVAQLEARRAREVYLEVRVSNVAARTLYERAGFHVTGIRRAYYRRPREDALVLRREIAAPA